MPRTYPFEIPSGTHLLPEVGGVNDLGSTTKPYANVYANNISLSGSNISNSFLKIDQSTPQTVVSGRPVFNGGISVNSGTIIGSATTQNINFAPNSLTSFSGNIVPVMTSNTAPAGYVASASSENLGATYAAWKAFDQDTTTTNRVWATTNPSPNWLQFQSPTARIVSEYRITAEVGQGGNRSPNTFNLQGSNNGSSWTTLNSQSGITYTDGQTRSFTFTNSTSYTYYRLNITSVNAGAGITSVEELQLIENIGGPVADISFSTNNTERARFKLNGGFEISTPLNLYTSTANITVTNSGTNTIGSASLPLSGIWANNIYGNQHATTLQSGTGGNTTINWNNGSAQILNFNGVASGTYTIGFSNGIAGSNYTLKTIQNTSGTAQIAWSGTQTMWPSGVSGTMTAASGVSDLFTFFYDGSKYMGNQRNNYY